MSRTLHRLKAKQVETLGPGRHSDGGGLYLDRDPSGRSRWIFMWKRDGKRREMGLGSAARGGVSLAEARKAADEARKVVAGGGDPIALRNQLTAENLANEDLKPERVPTFGFIADAYISDQSPQWRNQKHIDQWKMTLREYGAPLRDVPVDQIDTQAVLAVLKPIWREKPETASRLRGRIERILDAAKAMGHRSGENPARWRAHLELMLARRQKLTRGHHEAMPFNNVASFAAELRGREAVAALALEFLILTAARSGEVLGACWGEINWDAGVWTVPAERMKAGREHRVPLSARALDILTAAMPLQGLEKASIANIAKLPIFPGQKGGSLSSMSMAMLLRRMNVTVTVHGFRSSFRDWAGEISAFPSDLAEAALAHLVGDKVERAYRRGDALEKRREMMNAWAEFISTPMQ